MIVAGVSVFVARCFHGPNVFRPLFERVHVDHPAEHAGNEPPSRFVAFRLRRDRPGQSELRVCLKYLAFAVFRRQAEIHVLVPLRDAERNAAI